MEMIASWTEPLTEQDVYELLHPLVRNVDAFQSVLIRLTGRPQNLDCWRSFKYATSERPDLRLLTHRINERGIILRGLMNDDNNRQSFIGHYQTGQGEAHVWTERRAARFEQCFGCQLVGTFNVKLDGELELSKLGELPRAAWEPGEDVKLWPEQRYYPVRLTTDAGQVARGWFVRWFHPERKVWRPNLDLLEIYTKVPLGDEFKGCKLLVEIPRPWTVMEVMDWQQGLYWFQGHPWLANQRADSGFVWSTIAATEDQGAFAKKRVIDMGCHTGFYSFAASRAGAIVHGTDKDEPLIDRCRVINDHIELEDCRFSVVNGIPDEEADYLFCLSVLHQIDPTYRSLSAAVLELKKRAPVVWLELLLPPAVRECQMSESTIYDAVGAKPLMRYKHQVRGFRSVFRLTR